MKDKNQISNIRSEINNINTNSTDMKRSIREYYEHLYTNKLNNLMWKAQFSWETQTIKVSQEEIAWKALYLLKKLNL